MRTRLTTSASLFVMLIFIHAAAAQNTGAQPGAEAFPELVPIPAAAELAARAEPLTVEQLIDGAAAFSGTAVDPSAARDRILAHVRKFQAQSAGLREQRRLAEGALQYLHSKFLSHYSVMATSVDDAVRNGSYNCVSSAVLYAILARSVGLDVSAVRTVDHAFCSVMVDGSPVDVETTNVYGFDPGRKKEFTDSFGAVTGYTYVPPSNDRDRRSIALKELLALILYNRASEEGQAGRFREAVNPAVSAFALVGTRDYRDAMGIAFSNYATSLAMRGDFLRGLAFLDAVEAAWGGGQDLAQLRMEITHNLALSLIEKGALDEAGSLLEAPAARATLGDRDWLDLSVYVVQTRAQTISRTSGDADAAETVAAGMRRLGPEPTLLRTYEAYVHNAFARLYNSHRFDEARVVLQQGLAVYPSSATLARDMASLTAHR
jgi:tetratricopeptide (TPR) repeat protein